MTGGAGGRGEPLRPRLLTPPLAFVLASTLMYFVSLGALLPTLPLYVKGPLEGSSVAVGVSLGALSFAALVLNLVAGRLGDRHGRRILIISGGAVAAVSVAALTLARTVPILVALRLLAGAGEAMFFVGAVSAVNDLVPDERRGEAINLYSLALHSGLATGPIFGEWILAGERFQAVWIGSAAFAALAALAGTRVPRIAPDVAIGVPHAALVHPVAIPPGLVMFSGILGLAGFQAFVPLYARELGLGGSRHLFFLFSAVMVTVRTVGARLPDRLGPILSARGALLGTALGLAAIASWRTPHGLAIGAMIFALGHALLYPSMMLLTVRRAPAAQRAAVLGTLTSFMDAGFWLGPIALGFLATGLGYASTFFAGSAVAAAGLVFLWRGGVGAESGSRVAK